MKELQQLIWSGENDTLDFKKRITNPDRIARTIASFANTRGGIILVGVMDNGQIAGIDPEEEKHLLQIAATQYCEPAVKLFFKEIEEDDKTVLKVIIPESLAKPHLVKVKEDDWRGYIRVKDETVQTSKMVLKVIEAEEAEVTREEIFPEYDVQEKLLLEYLGSNRRITLKQYMKLVNISRRRAYRILVKLVLLGAIRLHDKEKETYFTIS
ncbi:AlbA family DNA-binding domain-containing protein [Adhaeribacter soli]|uniref:ATP-binding protein n=1 Tax=Adhaeribacter soli TaxID=2607655 RepID=A0A5N1J5A0_9BACT|nr:ATP-binding protein [Adhaeribacter soli]KAA9346086.1 ATP-binding protein [Adhaeribacter soli]